jgi:hypothetical protein
VDSLVQAAVLWRMEEAKLLWAQGQSSMAIHLVQALLSRLQAAAAADAGHLLRLQSLLGKWLALNRCHSLPLHHNKDA